jgi:hypothetical protein
MNAMAAAIEAEAEAPPPIGHNGAPEPTPFEAVKVHIEDLLAEAYNWADGTTVETEEQANEASRLIDDLNKAAKAAEEARVAEKKPLDDAIAEIQTRFNVYIADRKNKTPGKVWKAIDALKASVKPYLDRLKAEQEAAAEAARQAAIEAQRIATEAARAAQASDLAAQDAAEELVLAAKRAEATAKQVEAAKPQLHGGDRAMGLRKTYTPEIADKKVAMLHYMRDQPAEFEALVMQLAWRDVRAGKRQIPGIRVVEGTTL